MSCYVLRPISALPTENSCALVPVLQMACEVYNTRERFDGKLKCINTIKNNN